jgi:inosine-uridine nucleoside N-ribohydrolase
VPYGRAKRETGVLVHGKDGFAEFDLPEPQADVVSNDAPEFLARTIAESSEPVTLVTLGPLTNIAHMLDRFPDVKPDRMVMMGGAAHLGNVTPVAEFNVWHDPEAAQRVFRSHLRPVMVGLDATHSVKTYETEWDWLRGRGQIADMVLHFMNFYTDFYASVHGERMSHQHDAMAMAEAIAPGLLTSEPAFIDVETHGEITTGMTVVNLSGTPNATVCWQAPANEFHSMIRKALERLTDTKQTS